MAIPTGGLDTRLLEGFGFECRADCGLCCFTTPAVSPGELVRIRELRPDAEARQLPPYGAVLGSFPQGGACRMLQERRCSIYARRPGPCSMFPVTVHGSPRGWQASLVLSCPGLSLKPLARWGAGPLAEGTVGLDGELAAARARAAAPEAERARVTDARRRKGEARRAGFDLPDIEALRSELRTAAFTVTVEDLPGELPPEAAEGIEYLPLTWTGPHQVVAIEQHPLGLRALEVAPRGGVGEPSEVLPVPRSVPSCSPEAQTLLQGYLHYWLERDALFDFLLQEGAAGSVSTSWAQRVRRELGNVGATVLTRAFLGARLNGGPGPSLDAASVAWGIRATEMDLLDRPSWGVRL